MKYFSIVLFALLVTSCAKEETTDKGNENLPIVLSATLAGEADGSALTETQISSASNIQSRATDTAFEGGDELGLFVVKSGMEVQRGENLVNNHKMVVGGDGMIKGTPTAVYYPTQQGTSSLFKTNLYSYYPYQSGDATADALGVLVGIRTDQTDFSYLKRSDLCYGSAHDIAPSKAAQPITFKHSFAQLRINVSLYAGCPSIKQLRLINIKDSATLNIQTGALTLKSHTDEVLTYPNTVSSPTSFTAIIPAQTLAGACVAIDLVDPTDPSDLDKGQTYIYNAVNPINLAQSAANTLSLSVNEKGVITLTESPTISAWGNNTNSGNLSESVNNQISLYWLAPHADYATADKIVLTVVDLSNVVREIESPLTLDPKSSADYAVYTFPFVIARAGYPMIITQAKIYKGATLLRQSPQAAILGSTLSRAGSHVMGLNLAIDITPADDWLDVSGYGASRKITVTTIGISNWTATASGTGLTVSPTSGTSGQTVTISWAAHAANPAPAARSGAVVFAAVPTGETYTVNTTQNGVKGPPNSAYINGIWWALSNAGSANWYNAPSLCKSPWRLPLLAEAQALIASGRAQEVLGNYHYWSSTESNAYDAYAFLYSGTYNTYKYSNYGVRCVQPS